MSAKSFESEKILEFLQDPLRILHSSDIISKVKDFQEVEYHRFVAEIQRTSYKKDCDDYVSLCCKILIEFDFKEKIIVGTLFYIF